MPEPKFIQVGDGSGRSGRTIVFDVNDVSSVVFDSGDAVVFMKSHSFNHRFSGADAQALWEVFRAKGASDGKATSGL